MNEVQIFNNPAIGEIKLIKKNNKPQYLVIKDEKIDRFRLLSLASSISQKDEKMAWDIMRLASILFHPQNDVVFNELYDAVVSNIIYNNPKNEFQLYPKFKNKVKELFGKNAKVIEKVNDPHYRPDIWIRIENQDIPVEIKQNNFNKKSLKQLEGYMEFYNAKYGIAVGSKLTVKLPDNIVFIPISKLND
jgi:hypothetical protein